MKFLLDEAEMARVNAEREAARKLPGGRDGIDATLHLLTDQCKLIATTVIPAIPGRYVPYGCIHVNRRESYGYCDKCPVQEICPMPKDFSK